jgi:hydrogen cyanide synthase HcnC
VTEIADVVVIGGGAIGTAVVHALARRGCRVMLLDASTPGRATSASAGGLWPLGESLGLGCGVIFHAGAGGGAPEPLPQVFMDFLCASNRMFPQLADELRATGGVDIEAESGTGLLYLLYDEGQEVHAHRIIDYLARGDEHVEFWTAQQVRERDPLITADLRGAVYFPGDNQVNPMLLAEGLKRAAVARGAQFVAETRVRGLEQDHGRITGVRTEKGIVACGVVVNAAGAWAGEIARMAGAEIPIVPIRGQIVCTETLAPGTLRSNLSTRDCYVLQKAHGEVIIGSTTERSGFDVRVRPGDMRNLAAGAVRAVPMLATTTVKRAWAGLRPGTPDELPILGPASESQNLFHATGGFRTGIVAAPLTGEVVAASICGETPPCPIEPFLASRFLARAEG